MRPIEFHPIGTIRTPFKRIEGMPIQPGRTQAAEGEVVVDQAYEAGLEDIEGFSHLILLYHFHQVEGFDLKVTPFLDDRKRGLFATRAPRRPNAIGISIVSLLGREGNVLRVSGIDVLDRTPLLDIKPYVQAFDAPQATSCGWLQDKAGQSGAARSDGRFGKEVKKS